MSGFSSPDIPAYWCYGLVSAIGVMVAVSTENQQLMGHGNRWAFLGTWWLVVAYSLIPPFLLWLLDYTFVIQDTSLFGAVIVALGYRQVFAGSLKGISLPSQASSFWKPFEAWVARISDSIATQHKLHKDRGHEKIQLFLAAEKERVNAFEVLVAGASEEDLASDPSLMALKASWPPLGANRKRVRFLWAKLRMAEPENYGFILKRKGLLSSWQHWFWVERGRSILVAGAVLTALVTSIVLLSYLFIGSDAHRWDGLSARYHQWRFSKANASPADRFRSREYLLGQVSERETQESLGLLLKPVIHRLRFEGLATDVAESILRLVVDAHSPASNAVAFPELIEALRNPNADLRLRIHHALCDLQRGDYPALPCILCEGESKWVPAAEESPAQVDLQIQIWRAWWSSVSGSKSLPP